MNNLFREHGLTVLGYHRIPVRDDITKPWTDMQMMATKDLVENYLIPAKEMGRVDGPTAEEWREILDGLGQEVREGMGMIMDMIVAVGRKEEI